jgi:hypothetical protein
MAPFGQINACGGVLENRWFCRYPDSPSKKNEDLKSLHEMLLFHYSNIPLFHSSIISIFNRVTGV